MNQEHHLSKLHVSGSFALPILADIDFLLSEREAEEQAGCEHLL